MNEMTYFHDVPGNHDTLDEYDDTDKFDYEGIPDWVKCYTNEYGNLGKENMGKENYICTHSQMDVVVAKINILSIHIRWRLIEMKMIVTQIIQIVSK